MNYDGSNVREKCIFKTYSDKLNLIKIYRVYINSQAYNFIYNILFHYKIFKCNIVAKIIQLKSKNDDSIAR